MAVWLGLALGVCAMEAASALSWSSFEGYRRAPLQVTSTGRVGLTSLSPAATGIHFTNVLNEYRSLTNQLFFNGSGVAAGDVDGDGWCDLYWCGLDNRNALYRNLGGWKFEDITESAGVACEDMAGTGAVLADLDGDGDLDLIVNSLGNGTRLFANDGQAKFELVADVNPNRGGMSMALGDVDGDGWLDLYIANYRKSALVDMPGTYFEFRDIGERRVVSTVDGQSVDTPEFANRFEYSPARGISENGELDLFLRNRGGMKFEPISFTGGRFLDDEGRRLAGEPYDWGLSVMMRDINQDGRTDIFVCNDFDTADRVWINQGGGKFRALPMLAMRKSCHFSMGVDFADLNADGFDDFMVLDMMSRDHELHLSQMGDTRPPLIEAGTFANRPDHVMNMLYANRGDGTYAEIAQFSGVEAAEWAWAVVFSDIDLDGMADVLISNGQGRASRDKDVIAQLKRLRTEKDPSPHDILMARRLFGSFASKNILFRNAGGLKFEDAGAAWGFDRHGVSHGMALADLDNDGDQDVVVNNLNDPAGIYRNDTDAPRIAVRLQGDAPNTRGIGARIEVTGDGMPDQAQEIMAGGRYLSSDDPMRSFAAGKDTAKLRVEVAWPDGRRSVVPEAPANHLYEISQKNASPAKSPTPDSATSPHFTDVSSAIGHTHVDPPFNDHDRQYLIPHRLSQAGPGVSWFDLDGDGDEDLVVGSGKGGRLSAYRNMGGGRFESVTEAPFDTPVTRDQTTVLGWRAARGKVVLLAGSSNYEDGLPLGSCVRQYDLQEDKVLDSLPGRASATGPLAMADVDRDGDLDLFVGGRSVPGKYPTPAASALFLNDNGTWREDEEHADVLAGLGMVSGAVFADVDDDGDADLVLACDWGPVRVLRNRAGKFSDATDALGLTRYRGWWNGVNVGDFDGDGRLDIVASNWGQNTPYEAHRERPLRTYYGDYDDNGTVDILETHYDATLDKFVPRHQLEYTAYGMPMVGAQFNSHRAYARAGAEEILGPVLSKGTNVAANWLESTVFLNRGDKFEARVLPMEAQWAPAFGAAVGDLDGDGEEDIFLSQNFFSVFPRTPRYDAGRGLWLRGDGRGGFTSVPGRESGIEIYGEQRGAALADFDADGRMDLAVAQNAHETKLYRNARAKRGLRVRLAGPASNPHGVGVKLRLVYASGLGPVREVHAGAGYWSQDSVVQVLGLKENPEQLEVRWPGESRRRIPIPKGVKELTVDVNGGTDSR